MNNPKIRKRPTTTTIFAKHVSQNQCQQPQKTAKQRSWAVFRGLLTCKNVRVPNQQKNPQDERVVLEGNKMRCMKMLCSGSLCNTTKVMARSAAENGTNDSHKKRVSSLLVGACSKSSNASIGSMNLKAAPRNVRNGVVVSAASSSSSLSASSKYFVDGSSSCRGMAYGRVSGCYECRMVVDPVLGFTRDHCSTFSCPHCAEIFTIADNLEHHQATKHSVSELGPEDTSKNIVEIIFNSSWMKQQSRMCKIERILKIHNTQMTITKFEEYRESIKAKATTHSKKHPRSMADGNELLRFYATTLTCSLGHNGSSNLCNNCYAPQQCNLCSVIRNGFKFSACAVLGESSSSSSSSNGDGVKGILTMGTSGKAHDNVTVVESQNNGGKRAMVICRVIAGRVKKKNKDIEGGAIMEEEYDSVAGGGGANMAHSNLEELYVFNHTAILPCFVVIYTAF